MNKFKKALKIIGEIGKWILLVFIGLFAFSKLWNFIDSKIDSKHPFLGYRDSVIISGSMSFVTEKNAKDLEGVTDQFQINDVVVTSNHITYESLQIHDVIMFSSSKGNICHRIISKYETSDGKQMLVTRGDANELADGAIEYSCVLGKVVKVIPKVGYFVSFLNSPYFMLGASLTIGAVAIGMFIADGSKKSKKTKENKNSTQNRDKTEKVVSSKQIEKPKKELPPKDSKGRFVSTKKQ